MTKQIKASEIQPGMVVDIHGGAERVAVTEAITKWGAVQITDSIRWRGLSTDEAVELVGAFNP